jgi:hypothetical protein
MALLNAATMIAMLTAQYAAQPVDDTAAVERAAATYTAEHLLLALKQADTLKRGRVAFDARPAKGQVRSTENAGVLARILGAEVTARDAVIECASACHMPRHAALIRIELQTLTKGTAKVRVTREYPSRFSRVPVYFDQLPLIFRKRNGVWAFAEMGRIRSS